MKRNFIITSLSLFMAMFIGCNGDKTAYIDVSTVYGDFALSKKLEKEREMVVNSRQAQLDSIQIELNQISKKFQFKVDSNQLRYFNRKREEYYYKERQFAEDNQALLNQHNEQIMKQLNQYIEDYGKEKGYTYIYGATGNGSMMYADEKVNISKEVIYYINDKYNGVK